ncbi:hypothetical protein GLYMA_16G096400v4 [Glycine max]|nr:hypothetical protein GLYMA_16G096400v4 [Glycine max]KAG4380021.1 hypothetical protein GLYMA_16G096400v4 [Glycine max]KAG4380022.1 hypothetical protein GLYMA_16G096400v4 [Glycine max]KAH1150724.1 hypothetical protein GYH30_044642 [Glycine max]KAH1150725.1 hypothetical protein GYH30_044642 [Glycine max]
MTYKNIQNLNFNYRQISTSTVVCIAYNIHDIQEHTRTSTVVCVCVCHEDIWKICPRNEDIWKTKILRKKDESQENDFKDDVSVCLPLINTAIRDVEKGTFPKSCLLNVEFPTSLLSNKGFKLTKQSMWRSTPNWLAVSTSRYPTGHFLANQGGLGLQFAQLGPDASAAGAARRLAT